MTPEEQRIAFAEARGWKPEKREVYAGVKNVQGWGLNQHLERGDRDRKFVCHPCNLDDPNDLHVMHVAEMTLSHDQWRIYLGFLMGNRVIPKFASMEEFHKAWNATAAQRCEAFLKTVGKWKE